MKNQTATAMALALVAGVVGLAFAPISVATHTNCDETFELTYNEWTEDITLDSQTTVEIAKVVVPLVDPDTLEVIEEARLEIEVTSGSGDVQWVVSRTSGSSCLLVEDGSSASSSPDAVLNPGATYYIKTLRASGTSSVTFDMLVATLS